MRSSVLPLRFLMLAGLAALAAAAPMRADAANPQAAFGTPSTDAEKLVAPPANPVTCPLRNVDYMLGKNVLCITQDNTLLTILPSEAPPSRTRLSFDSPLGEHLEVEWNSTDGLSLSRTVVLKAGPWQVSFHVSPLPHPTDPTTDFAWKFFPADSYQFKRNLPNTDLYLGHVIAFLPIDQRLDDKSTKKNLERQVFIAFRVAPKPLLEDVVATLGESGGEAYASGFGVRSKDLASQVVTDALEVLTEIAMERAESRALDVVKQRVITHLCEPNQPFNANACKAAGSSDCKSFVLLASSCEALRQVRLRELAAAGPGLERAVVEDFSHFGAQAITQRLFFMESPPADKTIPPEVQQLRADLTRLQQQLGPLLDQVARTVTTAATKRANPTPAEMQGILHSLARMVQLQATQAQSYADEDIKLMRYGVSVAIATLSLCQQTGRCNGRFIQEVLESPQNFFNLKESLKPLGQDFETIATTIANTQLKNNFLREKYLKALPRLEKYVTQGLEVLQPPKDTPPREVAKNALLLVLDTAELFSLPTGQDAAAQEQWTKVHARIKTARDFVQGVFGKELQPLLLSTLQFIRAFDPRFLSPQVESESMEKGTRVLGALVAYAATYEHPAANGEERAQLQARRKETLKALIDIATDRKDREGESIISLGINVGLTAFGGRKIADGTDLQWQYLQLGLPMGLAYQHFKTDSPGAHVQLSVLDLGQYASFNNDGRATPPRWQTALVAGLQGGVILGSPQDPFIIGADVRYSPALFPDANEQNKGALSFGLFLGYYVPLFDLN